MYHVRVVATGSGAKAVRVIRYVRRKRVVVHHVGSAHDDANDEYCYSWSDANIWIEISGSNRGILNRNRGMLGAITLYCMCKDDTTYYLNGPTYVPGKCPDPDVLNGIRKQVQATPFLIYPNPTTGELRITNDELRMMNGDFRLSVYDLRLYDIFGRVVLENQQRISNNEQLDLSHLPAGIYLLEISDRYGRHSTRIVKR